MDLLLQSLSRRGTTIEKLITSIQSELEFLGCDPEAVYVCGSFAQGLENARSDLDVYCVTRAQSEILSPKPLQIGSILCDLQWVSTGYLKALAKKINQAVAPQDKMQKFTFPLTEVEYKTVIRLLTGASLINPAKFLKLKGAINQSTFSSFIKAEADYKSLALQLDIAGMWDSKDIISLSMCAQLLINHTCMSFLASRNVFTTSPKWVPRLLKRTCESTFLSYQNLRVAKSGGVLDASSALAFYRHVNLMNQADKKHAVSWNGWSKAPNFSGSGLRLDLAFKAREIGISLYEINRGTVLEELSFRTAAILASFDGIRSFDEIRVDLLNTGDPELKSISETEIRQIYDFAERSDLLFQNYDYVKRVGSILE